MIQSANPLSVEEARIRAAYQKRQQDDARYSWFNPAYQLLVQQRELQSIAMLSRYGFANLESKTVLEVGCGTGQWLRDFIKWGANPENIAGIDLLPDRVLRAKQLSPAAVHVQCASAAELGFGDDSFDIVLQSAVFTSILDFSMKRQVAAEMIRVSKPQGLILWYDYRVNNPSNQDVRGVKRREIYQLFPNCHVELNPTTLLPPLARALAPYSYLICYLLGKIRPLCTHYLGVIRKKPVC
jgi:ubiquinone/menaquinone biosynthesis C-methylase UbiE